MKIDTLLSRARDMTDSTNERRCAFGAGDYWNIVEELADELEAMREELELLRWLYAAVELSANPYASSSVFSMAFEMERAAGEAISALPAWRKRRD